MNVKRKFDCHLLSIIRSLSFVIYHSSFIMKKAQWRSLYPFESRFLDLGGYRMHYVDEQKGRRPGDAPRQTLLMIHGNPTWSFYFRNVIIRFRDKYRCVAPDHVGCGLSDKPGEKEYSYRLEERITDLCRLITELDLRDITLIAHDWGGPVAMGAAVRLPDRFSRLVLMNTAAFLSDRFPFRIRICRAPIFGRLAIQGLNLFTLAALRWAAAKPQNLSRDVRAGLLAPYDNWHNRTAVYRFVDDVPMVEKHPSYQTLLNIENNLTIFRNKPVALIWGMQDWCFSPEFLAKFLQFYPEATVHRLAEAGHYLLEDDPETVLDAIEQFIIHHS